MNFADDDTGFTASFERVFLGSQKTLYFEPKTTKSTRSGVYCSSISGGDLCRGLPLVDIRFNMYKAYWAANPQNFRVSGLENNIHRTIFVMVRWMCSALPFPCLLAPVFCRVTPDFHKTNQRFVILGSAVRAKHHARGYETILRTTQKSAETSLLPCPWLLPERRNK